MVRGSTAKFGLRDLSNEIVMLKVRVTRNWRMGETSADRLWDGGSQEPMLENLPVEWQDTLVTDFFVRRYCPSNVHTGRRWLETPLLNRDHFL